MSDPIKISYSSVQRFHECSEKYWLAKDYELAGPTPSPLVFGSNVEKGVEALLLGKSLVEALQIFDDAWSKIPHTLEYLASDFDAAIILPETVTQYKLAADWEAKTETDKDFYNQMTWLMCLIRGKVLIKAFHDYFLPDVKLHHKNGKPCTQEPVVIENDDGDKLVGFIDFVLEHKQFPGTLIADLKTASRLYTNDQIDNSEQLRTYIAARGHEFGTVRAGYIVLLKKLIKLKSCEKCGAVPENNRIRNCKVCKGNIKVSGLDGEIQFVSKEFKDEELQEQLDSYSTTIDRIKSGERVMNKESCYAFGRKCEFFDYCHSGTALDALTTIRKKEKQETIKKE